MYDEGSEEDTNMTINTNREMMLVKRIKQFARGVGFETESTGPHSYERVYYDDVDKPDYWTRKQRIDYKPAIDKIEKDSRLGKKGKLLLQGLLPVTTAGFIEKSGGKAKDHALGLGASLAIGAVPMASDLKRLSDLVEKERDLYYKEGNPDFARFAWESGTNEVGKRFRKHGKTLLGSAAAYGGTIAAMRLSKKLFQDKKEKEGRGK